MSAYGDYNLCRIYQFLYLSGFPLYVIHIHEYYFSRCGSIWRLYIFQNNNSIRGDLVNFKDNILFIDACNSDNWCISKLYLCYKYYFYFIY